MHDHVVPRKVYYTVFAVLLALLVLTIVAAEHDLGRLNTPIALGIAMAKAVLIALYFMHVRYNRPLIGLAAAAGILWLLLLLGLTLAEVLSRHWPSTPYGS
jgi:cytochrome c oxidase subunit 4